MTLSAFLLLCKCVHELLQICVHLVDTDTPLAFLLVHWLNTVLQSHNKGHRGKHVEFVKVLHGLDLGLS